MFETYRLLGAERERDLAALARSANDGRAQRAAERQLGRALKRLLPRRIAREGAARLGDTAVITK